MRTGENIIGSIAADAPAQTTRSRHAAAGALVTTVTNLAAVVLALGMSATPTAVASMELRSDGRAAAADIATDAVDMLDAYLVEQRLK